MANNVALIYDPRYQTFNAWAALMCELFASQQLQIPNNDTQWQDWAAGLMAIDVFTNEGMPSPYAFDDWQEWAAVVVGTINPRG